jgi:MFS family permease
MPLTVPRLEPGVAWPLGGMLLTQTAAAMALAAVPVLATEIARDSGVPASAVGAYSALVFGAAMFSSAASGSLIARLGALRANQVVVFASGLALLVTLPATLPAIVAGALLVGLGYGPNTPSGSHVLASVTPPSRRGVVFSVKQSGAQLGAMVAGLVLPWVAVAGGWRTAMVAATVLILSAALAVQPLHRVVAPRGAGTAPDGPSTLAAMRAVLATPVLRRLTGAAFVLMALHAAFQTFTVAFLVEHVGLALTTAGSLFAALAAAGGVARIVLGWTADRAARPRTVLVVASLVGAAACLLFAAFDASWSPAVMAGACVIAGAASAGWYGVFLAEVARRAPSEGVGLATGGALFFVYASIVAGPLAFSAVVALTGSWPTALVLLGATTLIATVNLLRMPG